MSTPLSPQQLAALRRLDSCTVCNAVEACHVRLRNEGFADASIRCMFPSLPPMVGYAVTAQIRCSDPPPDAHAWLDRTDWWDHILSQPAPRIVVIEDLDPEPGRGALLGEVHANILVALECVGAATNGAVRDLGSVGAMGFSFFARYPALSHSYAHIVKVGTPVEIGGLKVNPGDLLHGDPHGILSIPLEIAGDIPLVAARIADKERALIGLCRAPDFSPEKMRALVRGE
jgi:4-hydroxy-4-methyl-2-oxoglutarate aldolase